MKPYSLLILIKNTKKSKNNFKAPKKSEIAVFPGRIYTISKYTPRHAQTAEDLSFAVQFNAETLWHFAQLSYPRVG